MKMKFLNQLDFSTLLFDTIFGLILFYSFDALLDLQTPVRTIFYLFSMIILIHWWLMFKSSDDTFRDEVTDSAADIVFGIVDAVILYYLVQYSRGSDFRVAAAFLVGLFAADFLWAAAWRFLGAWRTKDRARITEMEHELDKTIALDIVFMAVFGLLFALRHGSSDALFAGTFIVLYVLYIIFTFRYKILDMDIF